MAGESAQRRSARKRATTTRYSDIPDNVKSSPAQVAKKRKVSGGLENGRVQANIRDADSKPRSQTTPTN